MANVRDEFEAALRAERVAARSKVAGHDGDEFYELMNDHWNHVKYDEKTGKGEARAGQLGMIRWHTSGSDAAVVVTIDQFPRIKASADQAAKALEELAKVLDRYGI
jgi:hypothetical protein